MTRVEPDRDQGVRVVEPDTERLVAVVQDHHLVTGREARVRGFDLVAEDPGMPGAQPPVLVLGEPDRRLQRLGDGDPRRVVRGASAGESPRYPSILFASLAAKKSEA